MRVIDSHTEGEPTRLVLEGAPDLGAGDLAAQAARLAAEHDGFRRRVLLEPRGHAAMVGALLARPAEAGSAAAAIYFNPVGALGMCGHATIGLAATLAYLGRIEAGVHRIETPAGAVSATLHPFTDPAAHRVSVENVESRRHAKDVAVAVEGLGLMRGDVAYGGNWFFLCADAPAPIEPAAISELTRAAMALRDALRRAGVTGEGGAEIDHIEFFGPADPARADSRNFVLCPGTAYDRSPCGTGTSAKLACLAADSRLTAGALWRQESVTGGLYQASWREGAGGGVIPTITGRAFISAETSLVFPPSDPFLDGIGASDGA
ncbi:MAG: proline racemase family protein [Pseudomonadota bacterium]